MGLMLASQASSGLIPRLTSLLCTSARLTVLLMAALNSWGVSLSAPGSRLSTARSAEASSTILFTFRGLTALRNQLVHQRGAWFYMPPDKLLCPLDAPLKGRDAQFVVFNSQHDLIADMYTQGLAEGCGNDDAAIFVDPGSGFVLHSHRLHSVTPTYSMTLFYHN